MGWTVAAILWVLGGYALKDEICALTGPQRGGAGYDGAVEAWAYFYRIGGRQLVDRLDHVVSAIMLGAWPIVMLVSIGVELAWARKRRKGRS